MIPAFACQSVYPLAERHGHVFVFGGRRALFPLPFFLGERAEDFVAGPTFHFQANCPWYMLVANGFDTQHFLAVHDRQILGPKRAYAYYRWIRESIAKNKPFDQFARELLTAEGPLEETGPANFYKVVTKPGETASTSAVSSMLSPPKKRISTI